MGKFDLEAERQKLTAALKAGCVGLAVIVRNNRLYLRGTLPPKPGSGKTAYHQQDITLGVNANAGGLKHARSVALGIASESLEQFDWSKYQQVKVAAPMTCSDWIRAFEQDYFTRRARTPKSETTWRKDYHEPLAKLPPKVRLTAESMLELIATTAPDSRSRKRYCNALGALAKFAGLSIDLSGLRGSYSPKAVQPRDLPDDALIIEWRERIPDEGWRWIYSVIAAYGLRPHECWHIDSKSIARGELIEVLEGKTGYRVALPYMPNWWADWELSVVRLPNVTAKNNRDYGLRAQQYFKRLGLPFTLYNLRHAWAARAAREGLDNTIAAKLQGHSPDIHSAVYQRFMSGNDLRAAWERTRRDGAGDV